jgi:plasmid stabilization system protein ParE
MNDLIIHPAAQVEYESAAEWYAQKNPSAADRFVSQVESAIQVIREQPEMFALVDDKHRLYLLHGFPYYVGYRFRPGLVEVVAIRHAAQDQDIWRAR